MKTKRKKRTTKQNHSKIQISVWRYCRITFILFLCLLPCLLACLLERSTAYMLCCSVPILLAHSHTTRLLCLTHSLTPSPLSLPLSLLLIHRPMLTPADQASKTRQSRLPMNFFWQPWSVARIDFLKKTHHCKPSTGNVSLVVTFLTEKLQTFQVASSIPAPWLFFTEVKILFFLHFPSTLVVMTHILSR